MKVFIVQNCYDDGGGIEKVFLSKDKAEAFAKDELLEVTEMEVEA